MNQVCYAVITFAPVQGFIENSRKLRDLYGSSYILSLLSWVICQEAKKRKFEVVSPATINVVQGMPNQIIIKGEITQPDLDEIKKQFNRVWKLLAETCRKWIQEQLPEFSYTWQRHWQLWEKHAWEFFAALGKAGETITEVRERLNQVKHSRDWSGINWQGESSTLSGGDAIAYPELGNKSDPRNYDYQAVKPKVKDFYKALQDKLGESFIELTPDLYVPKNHEKERYQEYGAAFIDVREEVSIPELIKRLMTHQAIIQAFVEKLKTLNLSDNYEFVEQISRELNPGSFKDLNRLKTDKNPQEEKYWTGWFLGDGDQAGKYFKMLGEKARELGEDGKSIEENGTHDFSLEMRKWGRGLGLEENQDRYLQDKGRIIYAGGDDFFGVLYKGDRQIKPKECLQIMSSFKSNIWQHPKPKKITSSVGFVWAGSQVPQRDILQHCRKAEKSAKKSGRDRIAFRILFNSGNHLEWVCPWWVLDQTELLENDKILLKPQHSLIESYQDRSKGKNWTHFYQDVATLESRHAFKDEQNDIALGLIEIYFGKEWKDILSHPDYRWNQYDEYELQTFTGILGDPKQFDTDKGLNKWVINLAKVGFYLTGDS
jgi:CRISPR-associated protein Cmr2